MADVAAAAAVSAMTVSRALRDPRSVTAATLRRIRRAIEATGYVPNLVAGSLASRRTNIVGMIVPSLRNAQFTETIKGISDILGPGHHLMIADSGYSPKGEEVAIRAFLAQRVCGIILHNTRHTGRSVEMLRAAAIPCVEVGDLVRNPLDMAVGFSNRDAGLTMTNYLIARGHRRIGFISLPLKDNERVAERLAGYRAALEAVGLEARADYVCESHPGLIGGGEAFVRLLEASPELDSAFITGDVLAPGAVLAANRRGWDIPGRIAIVASDDDEIQESVSPPLTTLRFPRYEIGRRAAGMVLDRLQGRSSGPAVLDLGFRLIERASA
jgi:LacI family gluconate utilization system Gnt-I transcriptional repressor